MIRQVYMDFIDLFEGLSPYELDHFSHAFYKRYKSGKKTKILNKKDLQHIIVNAMQDLQIEFAEQRMEEAKINLSLIKSRIYKKR